MNAATAPDWTGAIYSGAGTEVADTHRRGPERAAERPRTRTEYIDHVLAQIKGTTK